MTLSGGARLGPYEIVALLGAGGMGEVYRARDPRLSRDVAVKVLAAHLSATPDVRARFEREARAVAALNHPHICVLHDIGRDGDVDYLVMELVEGETLADRIAKGPLATPALLKIASEIAGALDRAHRAGIVHRDLKPANVMLTKSGVKLMDFGLARAVAKVPGAPPDATQSPSMTRPLTGHGTIVGTLQYMAPEQLEGGESDARADLWALGCVLYEMATGRRAFDGRTAASVISAVMRDEPRAMTELAPMSPPALARVVKRCLAKDPDDRWQSARDLMHELEWIAQSDASSAGAPASASGPITGTAATSPPSTATVLGPARTASRLQQLLWIAVGVAGVALGAYTIFADRKDAPASQKIAFQIPPTPPMIAPRWPMLSPDGTMIAFQASDSLRVTKLWIRPIDALDAHPIPGTESAGRPFWSPDSRTLAYFAGTELRTVAVSGGSPRVLCDVESGSDGTWGANGDILFDGGFNDPIRRVSIAGGEVSDVTKLVGPADTHSWPYFLPDGVHFLFTNGQTSQDGKTSEFMLSVGSLESDEIVDLTPINDRGIYAAPGYVVYARDFMLMACAFDAKRLELRGEPFPVLQKLELRAFNTVHYSCSATGALAYVTPAVSTSELVWVDRAGVELGRIGEPAPYRDLRISPDGSRVVFGAGDASNQDQHIWVYDVRRSVRTRITFGPDQEEFWPLWFPDGRTLAYTVYVGGRYRLETIAADGGGQPTAIDLGPETAAPDEVTPDGKLLYTTWASARSDISVFPLDAPDQRTAYISTRYNDRGSRLSPDGRWLAYTSDESGRVEVFVQRFPERSGKWQVSPDGGSQPCWSRDGRELFYLRGDSEMMAVEVHGGETFEVGVPKRLFDRRLTLDGITRNRYDVAPDGKRFLLNVATEEGALRSLGVILGWQPSKQ